MIRISPDRIERYCSAVLRAAGVSAPSAAATARGLVYASLRGVDSHGVMRLVTYVEGVERRHFNGRPLVRVERRGPAAALVDADRGFGFLPMERATDLAVRLARRRTGLAVVGVAGSRHFGMAGMYAERAAQAGMLALVTTNAAPLLGPPGGTRPVVGNNPLAVGIPRRDAPPIVLDIAFSLVAGGRILLAKQEGRTIPAEWAFDAAGLPTTDPAVALEAKLLAPVGGHKGYGLALAMEVLAGAMTGSPGLRGEHVGHLVIAIRPDLLVAPEVYQSVVEGLATAVAETPPRPGENVHLPGDPERLVAAERAFGIPLSGAVAGQLAGLGDRLGVRVPRDLRANDD